MAHEAGASQSRANETAGNALDALEQQLQTTHLASGETETSAADATFAAAGGVAVDPDHLTRRPRRAPRESTQDIHTSIVGTLASPVTPANSRTPSQRRFRERPHSAAQGAASAQPSPSDMLASAESSSVSASHNSQSPSHAYRTPARPPRRQQPGNFSSGQSAGSPASGVKSPLTPKAYFARRLRQNDAEGYRAAGVLAFRRTAEGKLQFLMGVEGDQTSEKKYKRLNLLGGKIDPQDRHAPHTAVREFIEESGNLLGDVDAMLDRMKQQGHGCLWFYEAKYALYLYEMITPVETGIVESYAVVKHAAHAAGRQIIEEHTEMLTLHWIDAETLLAYLATQSRRRPQEICDDPVMAVDGSQHPVISFTVHMLNRPPMLSKLHELVGTDGANYTPIMQRPKPTLSPNSQRLPRAAADASQSSQPPTSHTEPS